MAIQLQENQKEIESRLVANGIVGRDQLEALKLKAVENKDPLFTYLINKGILSDEQLTKLIAEVTNIPYVNLLKSKVSQEILKTIPQDTAERFMAVPLGENDSRLVVAMLDANNIQAVDYLSNKVGRPLKVYIASEDGIRNILSQYTTDIRSNVDAAFGESSSEIEDGKKADHKGQTEEQKEIKTIVQDSPISRALNTILEYATKSRASDVHIEPLKNDLKIRIRIDGVLREVMRLPKSIEPALVSRIKILATMKIDEHRRPQDGQFAVNVAGKSVDLRIAVSPVVWGEQVVIRILDKSGTSLKLEEMGYRGRALQMIRKGITKPNGMILTSGPTGSGKSTSMYALMQEIRSDAINIVTLEDPVEYKMEGVNQIQVNNDVGLTFASGLRSILRQDPDVVMVGEIRDAETAQLAVQAALTGHLVLSTLHTNSAAGVLPRLLDMGIEPFLIASTVNTVIGQRLVRRNQEESEQYAASNSEVRAIKDTIGNLLPAEDTLRKKVAKDLGYSDLPLSTQNAYTLVKGKESPGAPGGFRGRMGLYEVMDVNEAVEALILKRSTSGEIEKQAIKDGMVNMRQDGYLKAVQGMTTLAEVNRVAAMGSA